MKKKNIIIIAGAILVIIISVIIGIELSGDKSQTNQDTESFIPKTEMTEIESAVPEDSEQDEVQPLDWIVLSELTSYPETLRNPIEGTFNIKVDPNTGEKTGFFYRDAKGNTVKDNCLKEILMSGYNVSQMLKREDVIQALSDAACNTYADLDAEDTYTNAMMALNGYFNLLPDASPNYSNPNSMLSRAEFMAMVFRADNTVNKDLTVDKDFENAVGKSEYNLYAQGLADKTYLNVTDKSLNEKTYTDTISRAEAIYYFINTYFADDMAFYESAGHFDASKVKLNDATDGGDIAKEQGFDGKESCKSYELMWAINNPDEGLPTDLYKALAYAKYQEFIGRDTRWDEGLTKAEAIELMIKMYCRARKTTTSTDENGNIVDTSKDNRYYFDEDGMFDLGYTEDFTYADDIKDGVLGYGVIYNEDGTTSLKYNKDGTIYLLGENLPDGTAHSGITDKDFEVLQQRALDALLKGFEELNKDTEE